MQLSAGYQSACGNGEKSQARHRICHEVAVDGSDALDRSHNRAVTKRKRPDQARSGRAYQRLAVKSSGGMKLPRESAILRADAQTFRTSREAPQSKLAHSLPGHIEDERLKIPEPRCKSQDARVKIPTYDAASSIAQKLLKRPGQPCKSYDHTRACRNQHPENIASQSRNLTYTTTMKSSYGFVVTSCDYSSSADTIGMKHEGCCERIEIKVLDSDEVLDGDWPQIEARNNLAWQGKRDVCEWSCLCTEEHRETTRSSWRLAWLAM